MNVGELRRALASVSDTREVCFWYDEEYVVASKAHTLRVVDSSGYGRYSATTDPAAPHQLVFALEIE